MNKRGQALVVFVLLLPLIVLFVGVFINSMEGMFTKNKLDGICTLGFVRERYSYKGGDRQRGKNQQQVIAKIIEKISSSKTLIMNYDKLLKALSGSFETDLSTKNITSAVQFQLNDMRGWNITTANLDGPTGMEPTYTCPKCKRSVMYQNPKTIKAAQEKIKEILEKK